MSQGTEIETEVRVFMVDLFCKDCDSPMRHNGTFVIDQKERHSYKCVVCGVATMSPKVYPYKIFKGIDQDKFAAINGKKVES